MIVTAVLIEWFYIYVLLFYSTMLWTYRHRGAYPVLTKDEQLNLLRFLIHVQGVTRISHLREEWGIPRKTIKAHYAAEMREYRIDHPVPMKIHRPISPEIKERSRKLREERLEREKIRNDTNMRSYMKLDEAIKERLAAQRSVTDFYLHRNQKHG